MILIAFVGGGNGTAASLVPEIVEEPPATTAATTCFPPVAIAAAVCASATAGGSVSCGRTSGQIWCQGHTSLSGAGWSPLGLGPGATTWHGSTSASWSCTGLCECPSWATCTPAYSANPPPCTWALGSTSGCGFSASYTLPIVFAFEGTCIVYSVTRTSSTTATNGFASTATDSAPQTVPFC